MRFTIRDLLWLTVVVALAIGWYLDRSRLQAYNDFLNKVPGSELPEMQRRERELLNPSAPAPNPPSN
jgi:hypothetical protein